jgi:hypothetical protein
MSVECAVEIVSHAATGPCFQTTEGSQKTLDGLLLAAKVRSALVAEWPDARVSSREGDVYIDVEAPLVHEHQVAEEMSSVAKTVRGVAAVKVNVRPRMFP